MPQKGTGLPGMKALRLTRPCLAVVSLALGTLAFAAGVAAEPALAATPAPPRAPLADDLSPWLALVVGSVGSAAYLIALWVGLVGSSDGKARILAHFRQLWALKIPLFVASGGAVAMVFQLPEGKLIPVQAFIIGCTWPAVVSNYLSGKQSGEGEAQALATAQKQADTAQLVKALDEVPAPKSPPGSTKGEFTRLLQILEDPTSRSGSQKSGGDGKQGPVTATEPPDAQKGQPKAPKGPTNDE